MNIGGNLIIFGDSRELPMVNNKSVDIVFTTIPRFFPNRIKLHPKEIGKERTYEEYLASLMEVFKEVFIKMKDKSILIVHGNFTKVVKKVFNELTISYIADVLSDLHNFFHINDFRLLDEIILDSNSKKINNRVTPPRIEKIRVYYHVFDYILPMHKNLKKFSIPEKRIKSVWRPEEFIFYYKNLVNLDYLNKITPYNIVYELLNCYSSRGDTVLDPFLGSGTTLAATKNLKLNGIGVELIQKYERVIRKVIENA